MVTQRPSVVKCRFTIRGSSVRENNLPSGALIRSFLSGFCFIKLIFDLNIDKLGLKSDKMVTIDKDIPVLSAYDAIDLVKIHLGMENYIGELDFALHLHFGFKFHFLTWGAPVDEDDWYWELDDDNTADIQVANAKAKGTLSAGINIGPSLSYDAWLFDVGTWLTYVYGIEMDATPEGERFDPPDTKHKWHICDDCMYEEIKIYDGQPSLDCLPGSAMVSIR